MPKSVHCLIIKPLQLLSLLAVLGGLLPGLARAQQLPTRAYAFAASTAPYQDLTNISGFAQDIMQDNNVSRPYPIGFAFSYEGGTYSQFIVSSDGWLSLSSISSNNPAANNLDNTNGGLPLPLLAPFWDDLDITISSSAQYATLGTAPNREFVMEWRNWGWPSNRPNQPSSIISFQVRLFEATGAVQYSYRQGNGVPGPANQLSASIGLTGSGGFLSLSDASAAPAVSSTVSTNTIAQRPATGQVYTFTPPASCPRATNLAATATSATTASVSFVPASGNSSYVVNYTDVATGQPQTATGTASPVLLTGLTPNTLYQIYLVSTCTSGSSSTFTDPIYLTTPPVPNTTVTWTGTVSTAWDVAGNWSTGSVPTLTTDVLIPAVARQPVVSGPQTAGAVTLQTGATLSLATSSAAPATRLTTSGTVLLPSGSTLVQAAGTTLLVGGDLTNNGATLTLALTSTVLFEEGQHAVNGSAATSLPNLTLGELTAQSQVDIAAPVSVQRLLKVSQSSEVQVAAGGSLRLLSTAQVVRDADSFVNGAVTAERQLSGAGRHYYAAPVRTATFSQLAALGFTPVVNPAYNTSTTPVTPLPTVFSYDQSRISSNVDGFADFERGFASPSALTDAFVAGQGYRLDASGPATVAVTGPLNFTTVTRSGLTRATLPQSGYHLLGNPFAAALDWNVVTAAATTTGLDAAVYVYQPTGPGAGTYQSYVNGVGGPRYLLPGQGFFVRVSAASTPASVAFTQATRLSEYYDPANPPAAAAETRPLVQLTLAGATGATDNATVYFQAGASTGFDRAFDAHKLPTSGVPYLALAGPEPLAISGLPALGTAEVTLPLDVRGTGAGTYTLTATQRLNLPADTYLYLLDVITGSAQDLAQQPTYSFQLSTAAVQRFSLLFTRSRILRTSPASLSQQIALYPNPAQGVVQLAVPAELHRPPLVATLLGSLGQVVRIFELGAATGPRNLDLTGVAPGLYSLRLTTPQGTVTKRLVVE
ncbi:T9SS type A sorting domain-containing protein [Hymenobacter cellulosivorans]|uniref:T9SS type A sorting domain-containing protein n=1 Tax=Hymenobacter cellulosivorans TaxID=2932249 RepID=A0ABY4F4I8_9BACT|nr:T9SS type A sorting domain-containing protein [Hymenobacter cellulosivorans]UOQ51577.1 T9SS type A sorting domain-containing protein [Hymenobacter cellulosivorans]